MFGRWMREREGMRTRRSTESGIALILVLLLMLVFSVLLLGFYFMTTGEQKMAASDRDNGIAFYAAQGGIEKMSSDIAAYFVTHASVKAAQILALTGSSYQPNMSGSGVTFPTYTITCGDPGTTCTDTVLSTLSTNGYGTIGGNGPLHGLYGIIIPFYLTVVADGPNNTEVKMSRQVQEVAVPVFEFGIFSGNDLSFHAGADFNFGGRIHTNGNLFLAEDGNSTLTINDVTTAYKNVVRAQLSNGYSIGSGGPYSYTVNVLTAANGCGGSAPNCRSLGLTEGSVVGGPSSSANSAWNNLSTSTYGGYIMNGATGAKYLNLAIALAGGTPIAMIQRPPSTESATSQVGQARFFNQASLRILLSDKASALTSLPGAATNDANSPYPLDSTVYGGSWSLPAAGTCTPAIALSQGTADSDYMTAANTTLLGGYIKIEMQLNSTPGSWQDVTKEILSLGISRDTVNSGSGMGAPGLSTSSGGSLTASTTYYYVVTALGYWGETLGTEAHLATTSSNKTIKLTWSAFSGATGYKIYRGTAAGGENTYIAPSGTATSYTDSTASWSGGSYAAGSPLAACTSNNSIIHLQRADPGTTAMGTGGQAYVPLNIFDSREAWTRPFSTPSSPAPTLNGIMNLVEVDVHNLQKWFAGNIGTSGTQALTNGGYILYVSDRRMNCVDSPTALELENGCINGETGEFGNEDIINPSATAGTPNGTLDAAEDVDGDGVFRTYGAYPHPIATPITNGTNNWLTYVNSIQGANPVFKTLTAAQAQKNSVVLFRRAVRLVNGAAGNLPPLATANCSTNAGGFTVASENPVYVQGDYNASSTNGFTDTGSQCHVYASVMGDAVTLLSDSFSDDSSFTNPFNSAPGADDATTTYYRMGVLGGTNIPFTKPSWCVSGQNDCGTDGGVHNFLRYIEDWSNQTLNYLGSMGSFWYARQATGFYKYGNPSNTLYGSYGAPTRAYTFDTDFTNISKLPPGTPRFTDVNALTYQQAILPSQ